MNCSIDCDPASVLDLTDALLSQWEQIPAAGSTSRGKTETRVIFLLWRASGSFFITVMPAQFTVKIEKPWSHAWTFTSTETQTNLSLNNNLHHVGYSSDEDVKESNSFHHFHHSRHTRLKLLTEKPEQRPVKLDSHSQGPTWTSGFWRAELFELSGGETTNRPSGVKALSWLRDRGCVCVCVCIKHYPPVQLADILSTVKLYTLTLTASIHSTHTHTHISRGRDRWQAEVHVRKQKETFENSLVLSQHQAQRCKSSVSS